MKYFTFFSIPVLFITFNTSLFAEKPNNTTLIKCLNKQLHLIINTDQFNLTEDALVDNTGGYVDIPQERFYMKLKKEVFKIKALVTKENTNDTNQFQSKLDNKLVTELLKLKSGIQIKLIQKTDLLKNNNKEQKQNITTTNIIYAVFTKRDLEDQYQKCQK